MASLLERQSRYQADRSMGCAVSTASYESPPPGFHHSQPATPENGLHYQSRTLPRPRRNRAAPSPAPSAHNPASSRRQMVSSAVSDYLKSLNSMTRSIVLEKEFVEERHAGEWPVMDETLQEEVVDEHFMPPDVHAHYGTLPRSRSRRSVSSRASSRYGDQDDVQLLRNRGSESNLQTSPTPPPAYSPQHPSTPPTYFIPPTYNRLHKNQLSYRSKALRKVMNMPQPPPPSPSSQQQHQKRDSGLGSDGESPRTSDEDMHNALAFRRSHLRSYSLRQRRGSSRNPNSVARSSARRMHRVANDETRGGTTTHRPSPLTGGGGDGYDAEVDLPDDSLLLDHVSSHEHEPASPTRSPQKPPSRYSSRARRSLRMQPRVLADKFGTEDEEEKEEVVVIPNHHSRVTSSSSSDSTSINHFDSNLPMYRDRPAVVLTNLRRAQSEESIDTDMESIAPSNISLLSKSTGILTEDDILSDTSTIRTCDTPDSILSVASSILSKTNGGIVRSRPQSLRGGSFYQTSTSEFANRRAQFKPNMLRNQQSAQNSPTHSRQPTPALTRESTPALARESTLSLSRQNTPSFSSPLPPNSIINSATNTAAAAENDRFSKPLLKSPPISLPMKQRCSSATESVSTAEPPTSPEELSQFSSPPHTPMVKSIMRGGASSHYLHLHRESQELKRESGYISSSSESFAFSARR